MRPTRASSRSCIAWAGALRGHRFIHEAAADAPIRRLAHAYAIDDVIPVLTPSPVNLPAYRDQVLERFRNPAIADTIARVAADSFARIPAFIAPTVNDRLRQGASVDAVAALAALYLAFLQRWLAGGIAFAYSDQALQQDAGRAICAAADPVLALASQQALWGDAAQDPRWAGAVRRAVPRVASALT